MKKKPKFVALFLAFVMVFSLMATPAFAATSGNPYATPGTTYGGNPYAPVVLGPGTVVKEEQLPNLIHVFMENQVVVTMDEQFVLNYTSTASYTSRGFSSQGGYAWLAEAAIDRAIRDKSVARAADGKSCIYGDKVINLATADGKPLPIDYLITNFFRQPVTEIRVLDTVSYKLTARNGKTTTSYISVRSYGDAVPDTSPTTPTTMDYDIWEVRDLDDGRIEVYLRNGMIVTLEKAMIVDWVNARKALGGRFKMSYWHDRYEMDDESAETCVDFGQKLLDALIAQGWTTYPTDLEDWTYNSWYIPEADLMCEDVGTSRVLVWSLENARGGAGTEAEVTIYFDYYNAYGRWTHSTGYTLSFEFLGRVQDQSTGFAFWTLTRPGHFTQAFDAARTFWLTSNELRTIRR